MKFNFSREPWRKLYVRESLDHLSWPVLWRGVRDYLIRHASDDGTLLKRVRADRSPAEALARAIGAHDEERASVIECINALLEDEWLLFVDGSIVINRFEEAQQRAKSTDRVRRHRAKQLKTHDGETFRNVDPKRENETETIRNDPKRSNSVVKLISQADRDAESVIDFYNERWRESVGRGRPPSWNAARRKKLSRLLGAENDAERFTAEDLRVAAAQLFRSQYHLENGYTTPEYFMRSPEQVEKMISKASRSKVDADQADSEALRVRPPTEIAQ